MSTPINRTFSEVQIKFRDFIETFRCAWIGTCHQIQMTLRSTSLSGTSFFIHWIFNESKASNLWLCSDIIFVMNYCMKANEMCHDTRMCLTGTCRHWTGIHCSNLYSECCTGEDLEGFKDLKIRGKIIRTVKYADELVLLAKEETVLQSMTDRLIETGRCYRMEMNVENSKVMIISRGPTPLHITIDQKQLENVEYFNKGIFVIR